MRIKKIVAFLLLLNVAVFPIHKSALAEPGRASVLPMYISDTYQEEDVLISFNRAYGQTDQYREKFCIELNVKVLAKTKIIKPDKYVYGIYVLDNFGNDLDVISMAPRYFDSLRPGEERLVVITFRIRPLEDTKYLLLQIPKGIFGNVNPFELKMYNTGFKNTITTEERAMMESGIGSQYGQKESAYVSFVPDDIGQKRRDRILYAAMFIGLCSSFSLVLLLVCCLKRAKETTLCSGTYLSFLAHWLKQNRSHLSILYILSALISLVWLVLGIIIVMAGGIGAVDNVFGIAMFLASWALLSFVSLWMIYEILHEWLTISD